MIHTVCKHVSDTLSWLVSLAPFTSHSVSLSVPLSMRDLDREREREREDKTADGEPRLGWTGAHWYTPAAIRIRASVKGLMVI